KNSWSIARPLQERSPDRDWALIRLRIAIWRSLLQLRWQYVFVGAVSRPRLGFDRVLHRDLEIAPTAPVAKCFCGSGLQTAIGLRSGSASRSGDRSCNSGGEVFLWERSPDRD